MSALNRSTGVLTPARLTWRLIRFRPVPFSLFFLALLVWFLGSTGLGLIEKGVFDTLTDAPGSRFSIPMLLGLYAALQVARMAANVMEVHSYATFLYSCAALLRKNIVAALFRRPGAQGLPLSMGEALSRLDSDVGEVSDFPMWLPWMVTHLLTALVAFVIMLRINARITLVVMLPLASVAVISRLAWARLLANRRASRRASDAVTGMLGEMFGAVQAIKVADAADSVIAQLDRVNDVRRHAAVRDALFNQVLNSLYSTSADIGVGIMLLLAARAMVAGQFTVGDFALFVYYLSFVTGIPALLGTFVGDWKQQEVALDRLKEFVPDEPSEVIATVGPIYDTEEPPEPSRPVLRPEDRLETLEVRGLTYLHPSSGKGIEGVDLYMQRGEFVVVTGQIGSGKSTLLRVLSGLLPRDSGQIEWNGRRIFYPAHFFVPPRSAYTPQVPRLFSEPLRDNILMGLQASEQELAAVIYATVLEPDVAVMPQGLDTVVGPRGVRLSGGQIQRAAAARMVVRHPELLLCDDLSSALDVETEQLLWQRLLAGQTQATCLVVSHRRPV
ncbi:MAG: ABC transporter ATP-binding protein/permease, partial [Chloroflexota bacterium]|nr:ABC transporter ATP-binding protein/permease [Chloroflexota bacterium]